MEYILFASGLYGMKYLYDYMYNSNGDTVTVAKKELCKEVQNYDKTNLKKINNTQNTKKQYANIELKLILENKFRNATGAN